MLDPPALSDLVIARSMMSSVSVALCEMPPPVTVAVFETPCVSAPGGGINPPVVTVYVIELPAGKSTPVWKISPDPLVAKPLAPPAPTAVQVRGPLNSPGTGSEMVAFV